MTCFRIFIFKRNIIYLYMKLTSRKLIWNVFPYQIEIISMNIQMLTNILINIRIISSQYILSMIYVKAALSLSMCFLAPSLSYFPFFITNRYFLQTKRFWDTRVCFPYVCLCLMLNQKTLDEMSIDIVRAWTTRDDFGLVPAVSTSMSSYQVIFC